MNSEQIVLEYKRRGRATICSSSSFDSHLLFMILFLSFPIFFHFTTKKLSATWRRIRDGICSCLNGLSNTFFRWTACRNDRKYRILFTQIVRQVNYQIGESEKQKDGSYIVELEIRPVTLFSDTYETFQSKAEEYAQSITNEVMKGMEIPSEEEMQGQVYQIYYDVLNEALQEGIRYGDKKKLKLHVEKGEDGAYEIREKDRRKLDQLLVENAGKNSA